MIEVYKGEENKRKEIELNLKKQELEFPEKKKRRKSRDIHIVTKPCSHIIQKNSRELIVRQVNEAAAPNDEVSCEPTGHPPLQHPHHPMVNHPINPNQIHQLDQQYVLVPIEFMKHPPKVRRARSISVSHPAAPPPLPPRIVESVATQTSDRSLEEEGVPIVEQKTSEDWLSAVESKDGERIDVDEEYDEEESEKYMKRRRQEEEKEKANKKRKQPEMPSDEVRVSIENDSVPPQKDSGVSETKEPPKQEASKPKKVSPPKEKPIDKSYVASEYIGQTGEMTTGLSTSNNSVPPPPPKSTSPAARPSIFPYWVDPKAPTPSVSTSKASSKLTKPEGDDMDGSCALYRTKKKSFGNDSDKVYMSTPKSKTPKK